MAKDGRSTGVTPAAIAAMASGDMANAAVALTPGGIEAQEKAGQTVFAVSETLPTQGVMMHRDRLTALGFVLGEPVDAIFLRAKLPPGWKKVPTEHSMWTDLLDDKGRRRAGIFYKAAFYDRSAHVQWEHAVECVVCQPDGSSRYDLKGAGDLVGVVKFCGGEVYRTAPVAARDDRERWDVTDRLYGECRRWADENYPESRDPFAYW